MRTFLYSPRNIAGCVLALGGLLLFFIGIIHSFWLPIVAGLYGVGVLGWPQRKSPQTAGPVELPANELAQQVRRLIESAAAGLPKEAIAYLWSMQVTLTDLLPRLKELRDRSVISPKDSFTVTETVRRYLPDTLGAYLRLPRAYAQMQPLADGRTASQTLLDQLRVLDKSLKDIAVNAFAGDAEMLITNGRFLENRFAEKPEFRPKS